MQCQVHTPKWTHFVPINYPEREKERLKYLIALMSLWGSSFCWICLLIGLEWPTENISHEWKGWADRRACVQQPIGKNSLLCHSGLQVAMWRNMKYMKPQRKTKRDRRENDEERQSGTLTGSSSCLSAKSVWPASTLSPITGSRGPAQHGTVLCYLLDNLYDYCNQHVIIVCSGWVRGVGGVVCVSNWVRLQRHANTLQSNKSFTQKWNFWM